MSFPGRGRRVLNPEEAAVPVPGCPAARSHQDSCLDPQGLCQRAKLEPALSSDTQSHQPLWSTAGAPGSSWGQGCLTALVAPCLPPPPALAPGRGLQHILSRDTELQPSRLLVRRVTQSNSVRKHLATRPGVPQVQLPGYQVKALSTANSRWFGLQTRYSLLGEDQR